MKEEIDKHETIDEKPSVQTQSQQQDGSHTDNGEWGWEALGSEDDVEVANQPVVVEQEHDNDNDGVEEERNLTQELDSPTASQSSPSSRREGGRSYFSRTSKDRLKPDSNDGGDYQPQQHQSSNSQVFGQRKQGQNQRNISGVGRHSSHNLLRPSNSSGNFNNISGGGGGKGSGSGKALKGITSSPSFQELEKAIALSLESSGESDQYMPGGSSGRLSSINITNQKIQQQQRQRQHHQQHQQMSNRFVSQNMGSMASYGSYGAGPYGQLFPGQNQLGFYNIPQQQMQFSQARNLSFNNLAGMTAGANPMSMGLGLQHVEVNQGPSAREELGAFINESESRALIIFHSPTVTPIAVRDACQKFGVLYYIRPEFHSKGVTLISYFDLRSALESYGNIATELGPEAEASAHYSVMLHTAGNSEEYRLVVRNLPERSSSGGHEDSDNGKDSDETEAGVRTVFSRYGPLRSVQRLPNESTDSTNTVDNKPSTGAFSVEFYNIQDARLAGSELAATSGHNWSPETTVKFAPLDERRQQLCKQLLATLSRWRTELAAATAAMQQQMQMQQMQMQMSMTPNHSLMMMGGHPQSHLNMNMGNVAMNMNMGNMAQVPMALNPMGSGMTSALPIQLVGSNGSLATMVHMPPFAPVMQGNTMTFFGQGPPNVQGSGVGGPQDEQAAVASGRGSPIMTFTYGNAPYPQQIQQQQDSSGQTHYFAVDVSSMNGNSSPTAYGTAAPLHTQLQSLSLTDSQQLQQQQNMQQFQQQQINNHHHQQQQQQHHQQQQQQQQEMQKYHQQQQQQYQQQTVAGWTDKDGQTAEKLPSPGAGKSYQPSPAARAGLVSGSVPSAGSSAAPRPYHQMQAPPPLIHQLQGQNSALGVSRSDIPEESPRTVGLDGITVAHPHHIQNTSAHHGLLNNSSHHGRQGSMNASQHAPTHHYGQPGQGSGQAQGQGMRSTAQRHGGRNSMGQGAPGVQGQGSTGQYHLTSTGSTGVRENQIDADFALDLSRIDEEKENRTTIMVRCTSL